MKKIGLKTLTGTLCMVFALLLVLPLSGQCAEKVYKIGIAQFITHPSLDLARKGFIDQMVKEGFVDGKNIKYYQSNAEADMSLAQSIARKFVSQKVDMIQSITTPMSQACVAAARGTDIPIVFSAVTDPVKGQLVDSWDKPGGNVTGASDWMDVESQIALILDIMQNVQRIGVLYNPGEINSQVQVAELKKAAKNLGIEKVVEGSVPSTSDALVAARSLVGRADAIWIPTDSTTVSALEAISKICQEYDLPLFGSDVNMVPRGVIAAKGLNMYDLGKDAGRLAARVLRGENPANIPIMKAEMKDLWVYPKMAEDMGIEIPKEVMDKATKIITD